MLVKVNSGKSVFSSRGDSQERRIIFLLSFSPLFFSCRFMMASGVYNVGEITQGRLRIIYSRSPLSEPYFDRFDYVSVLHFRCRGDYTGEEFSILSFSLL